MRFFGWPRKKKTGMAAYLEELEGMEAMARGNDCLSKGRPQEALPHYKRALDAAAAKGDADTECQCLALIGTTYVTLNKFDDALTFLNKALILASKQGDVDMATTMQRGIENVKARRA